MAKEKNVNLTPEEKKAKKKKRARIIIIAVVLFLLINNTIATKIIYDNIFKRYDKPIAEGLLSAEDKAFYEAGQDFKVLQGKYTIAGKYFPVVDDSVATTAVIIAPGLHAGMENYTDLAECFTEAGMDVYSFDPVGTRASEGKSCISYSQESYDLDAVLYYVQSKEIYEDIFLVGHSRGATAAISLLNGENKKYTSDSDEISGVISISGFDKAMDAVIGLSSTVIGPVANANYPTLWAYQLTLCDYTTFQTSATAIINDSDAPVYVIQGSEDDMAPVDQYSIYSKRDGITNGKVTYELCSDSQQNGHTSLLYNESGEWNETLLESMVLWMEDHE